MQETQETRVQSLGQEDPLEEEMASHSSILTWKTQWTEEPGGLQSIGSQESETTQATEYARTKYKYRQNFNSRQLSLT